MKLTRLRLLGFKSFVEPTDFLIEPGLNRRGRPKRLREIESGRSVALGHGRIFAQIHARGIDGRCHLFRLQQPARAKQCRGRDRDRQFDALGTGCLQRSGLVGNCPPDRA